MQKFIVKLPRIAELLQELYATFVTSYFFFQNWTFCHMFRAFCRLKIDILRIRNILLEYFTQNLFLDFKICTFAEPCIKRVEDE